MKFILIFYFLIISLLSFGQEEISPFEHLPSLQRNYGKLDYNLNKDLVEFDSILKDCDEVFKIIKEYNSTKKVLNVVFELYSKGTKKETLILSKIDLIKDSLLLKIVNYGDFICFLRNDEIVYFELTKQYDNTFCEKGPGIWNAIELNHKFEKKYFIQNNLFYILDDESISILNFRKNSLSSTFYSEFQGLELFFRGQRQRNPHPLCNRNIFNLQENYCTTSEYSYEFIQKVNMQVEKAKSEKAALEEIYRRVKGSNLFKKF
jgi:hypothetical protein